MPNSREEIVRKLEQETLQREERKVQALETIARELQQIRLAVGRIASKS